MPIYLFFKSRLMDFVHSSDAAMAPIFALLLIPLLGTAGMSFDLGNMMAVRAHAQTISDAGAINALRIVQSYMNSNGNTQAVFSAISTTATSNTQTFMTGLASALTGASNPIPTTTITYSTSTNAITVSTKITYTYQTSFMGMIGVNSVAGAVTSGATSDLAKYVQVIFLVDVSESMGVGATANDVTALQANANIQCAFACHQTAHWNAGPDYEALAHAANLSLKIDYARAAVKDFTTQLSSLEASNPGHYSAGIYTFSGPLNTVLPATTNFTNVTNALASIDLDDGSGNEPCASFNCTGWTDLSDTLTGIKAKISNIGDGSSASSQLTYLILVTDGVEDIYWNGWGYCCGHYTDTNWASNCTALKTAGINVSTVQAVYTPFTDDFRYVDLVEPIVSGIPSAMKSCASNGSQALSASDGPGLEAAIDSLFAVIASVPRLTN